MFVAAEATPACRVSTDAITAAVIGVMVMAMPVARTMKAGRSTVAYGEPTWVRSSNASPPAANSGPIVMNHREPYRSDRRPETGATTRMTAENANSRIPAPTGEYPCTFCRYSDRKNTLPNMAKNTAPATTLAAANVGIRKKASGSMGDSRCDSTKRKVASNTAATANAARISPSVQPLAFPSISA